MTLPCPILLIFFLLTLASSPTGCASGSKHPEQVTIRGSKQNKPKDLCALAHFDVRSRGDGVLKILCIRSLIHRRAVPLPSREGLCHSFAQDDTVSEAKLTKPSLEGRGTALRWMSDRMQSIFNTPSPLLLTSKCAEAQRSFSLFCFDPKSLHGSG